MKIMILNGPNLNFLGIREKNIYGQDNYQNVCKYIMDKFDNCDIEINIFQSNIEGEMINILQMAYFEKYDGIVINLSLIHILDLNDQDLHWEFLFQEQQL